MSKRRVKKGSDGSLSPVLVYLKSIEEEITSGLVSCEETFYIYSRIQTRSVLYLDTRIEILEQSEEQSGASVSASCVHVCVVLTVKCTLFF